MEEVFKKIGTSKRGITFYVSNKGRIKRTYKDGSEVFVKGGNVHGYLYTTVFSDAKKKFITSSFHRLVAEAFIENPYNLKTVNHKDENKQNNCVENLEWMSMKDNIRAYNKNHLHKRKSYVRKTDKKRLSSAWASHAIVEESNERIKCWVSMSDALRQESKLLPAKRHLRKLTDDEKKIWKSFDYAEDAADKLTEVLNQSLMSKVVANYKKNMTLEEVLKLVESLKAKTAENKEEK